MKNKIITALGWIFRNGLRFGAVLSWGFLLQDEESALSAICIGIGYLVNRLRTMDLLKEREESITAAFEDRLQKLEKNP